MVIDHNITKVQHKIRSPHLASEWVPISAP